MQSNAMDLRKGYLVTYQGRTCTVIHWNLWKSDRRSRVQLKVKDLITGRISEITAQGDDRYEVLESEVIDLAHSYREGEDEIFYTPEGEEYRCPAPAVEDVLVWKTETYKGLLVDGKLLTINLPQSVVATVVDTAPPMKGGGSGTKDAVLDNGVKIKVGLLVSNGDKVRVDPETLEYKERV